MKLAFKILRISLTSLRKNAGSLAFNAAILVVILVGLQVLLTIGIPKEDPSFSGRVIVSLVRVLPDILLPPAFIVFAHRLVLCPDALPSGRLSMSYKVTEVRFMFYSFIIGITVVVTYLGLVSPILVIPFFWRLDPAIYQPIVVAITICAIVLMWIGLARVALFAPLVVLGNRTPFRTAWKLGKGHLITLTLLAAVLALATGIPDYILTSMFGDMPTMLNDVNLLVYSINTVFYSAFCAFAATALSVFYLELTRTDGQAQVALSS